MSLSPMLLIAGPCVLEEESLVLEIAQSLSRQLEGLPIDFYFKASFDKANRTSIDSYRGPGIDRGLKMLSSIRDRTGLRLLTDVHLPEQVEPVSEVVDFLQTPAFLCRQTDLLLAAARAALRHQKRLNIKKGQFLAPWDVKNIVDKVKTVEKEIPPFRKDWLTVTERGVSFGYNTLVVDMSAFQCIQKFDVPVIYDATHSIQIPGQAPGGKSTGGKREYLEVLARGAVAAGANGIFLECHPDPSKAKSDGPNAMYLDQVGSFVRQLLAIRELVSGQPKLLPEARAD